jgi:hypothetical protein
MRRTSGNFAAVIRHNSLILLARIVDRAGLSIRPADVQSLAYSVDELDPFWSNLRTTVPGHNGVELKVEQIFFDRLQVDGAWTVDCTGYNFLHEIRTTRRRCFPRPGADYELRYQVTSKSGEKTVVRFRIGCSRFADRC